MRRVAFRIGLALASAGLLPAYAQFPALAFLPYVALVPWLVLYGDRRGETPSHLWYVVATIVTWIFQYTLVMKYGWFVPPVMALFYTPVAWLFTPLLARVKRLGLPLAITVPILWTAGGLDAGTTGAGQAARIARDYLGNVAVVSGPATFPEPGPSGPCRPWGRRFRRR